LKKQKKKKKYKTISLNKLPKVVSGSQEAGAYEAQNHSYKLARSNTSQLQPFFF
jgi:hypothetical protein